MHGFLEAQLHCGDVKFTTARKCLVDRAAWLDAARAGPTGEPVSGNMIPDVVATTPAKIGGTKGPEMSTP